PETLAASAGGGLDRERPAELFPQARQLAGGLERLRRARHDRYSCVAHSLARGDLRAHRLDGGRRRADPDEARLLDERREPSVLGEEAVPGMDRLRTRATRDLDDPLCGEVGLRGRAAAQG